ncbi:MAG: hypothetical protein ACREPL_05305 [Rhodanobacteraceae bacterium]
MRNAFRFLDPWLRTLFTAGAQPVSVAWSLRVMFQIIEPALFQVNDHGVLCANEKLGASL